MPESFPTLLAGQRITAGLLTSMLPQVGRKPADTSRTSNNVQAPDPHIQFSVVAGGVYTVSGYILYDSDAAVDIILSFQSPSGTNGRWTGYGTGTTVVSGTAGGGTQQNSTSTWGYTLRNEYSDITQTRTFGGLGVGQPQTVMIDATLRVGVNSGAFGLQWSQATSSAIATTVYTDSWLSLQRIA